MGVTHIKDMPGTPTESTNPNYQDRIQIINPLAPEEI